MTDFNAFWLAYPRKEGKGKARIKWGLAIKKEQPCKIIELLELQTQSGLFDQKRKDAIRQGYHQNHFIAQPARWLFEERWDDEIIVTSTRQPYRNGATELAASIAEMIAAEEADAPMYDLDAQTRLTGPDWRS